MSCEIQSCVASHSDDSLIIKNVGMNQHLEIVNKGSEILFGLFGAKGAMRAFFKITKSQKHGLINYLKEE